MVITLLKLLGFLLRTFTPYSATALPGLILEKYFPHTLKRLLGQLDRIVLITGTNGKTTTARLLGHLLRKNDIDFIANPSGSNLVRGVASALLDQSTLAGELKVRTAVFEVEEASLPTLVKHIQPKIIVVTNFFRDQLDAYGEVDKSFDYVKQAVKAAGNPRLVLNGDDPRAAALAVLGGSRVDSLGFDLKYRDFIKWERRQDLLPTKPTYVVKNIRVNNDLESTFDLVSAAEVIRDIRVPVPGIFNCFNAAAAILAFAATAEIDVKLLTEKYDITFADFRPAFGRGEIIKYGQTSYHILLAKNPAGVNLNLRLLEYTKSRETILFILNDKTADGRDVSWIWDADLGLLRDLKFRDIFVAGTRRWDLALRLEYEGMKVTQVFASISQAVASINRKKYRKVFVLPTYTAMLEFRRNLGKKIND